jgi:hypothetical protein
MRLLALECDDQALDLLRQLIGIAHRTARPIAKGLGTMILIFLTAFEEPPDRGRQPDKSEFLANMSHELREGFVWPPDYWNDSNILARLLTLARFLSASMYLRPAANTDRPAGCY